MKNEKQLKELLDEAVTSKITVDVQFKPELAQVSGLIRKLFPHVGKQFKNVLNCLYFAGGVPKSSDSNKMKIFLDNFAGTISLLHSAGKDQPLASYLKTNYGIEISFSGELEGKVTKKIEKQYSKAFHDSYNGETPKELLKMSIDSGLSLVESISIDSMKMNDEIVSKAEKECDITPAQFNQALKVLVSEKRTDSNPVEKLNETICALDSQKEFVQELIEKVV